MPSSSAPTVTPSLTPSSAPTNCRWYHQLMILQEYLRQSLLRLHIRVMYIHSHSSAIAYDEALPQGETHIVTNQSIVQNECMGDDSSVRFETSSMYRQDAPRLLYTYNLYLNSTIIWKLRIPHTSTVWVIFTLTVLQNYLLFLFSLLSAFTVMIIFTFVCCFFDYVHCLAYK